MTHVFYNCVLTLIYDTRNPWQERPLFNMSEKLCLYIVCVIVTYRALVAYRMNIILLLTCILFSIDRRATVEEILSRLAAMSSTNHVSEANA